MHRFWQISLADERGSVPVANERAAHSRADSPSQEEGREGDCTSECDKHGVERIRKNGPAAFLAIYVSEHCSVCLYALEVAERIRSLYPNVAIDVIDVADAPEAVPEAVFATPTYLLNGRVWSLGNPSEEMIRAAFG